MRSLADVVRVGAGARRVLSAFALGIVACLPPPVFECTTDEQCADVGVDAVCEAIGYCSVPDDACDSARRFDEYAGHGLANACTDLLCGDGEIDEGEQCDDANDVDGDGCNSDCRMSGSEIWTTTYASPGFVVDRAYGLAIDRRGDIAVIGHVTVEGQGANVWIRKYTTDGEAAWTWVLDGDAHLDEEGWSILVDDNDDFIAAGYVTTTTGGPDAWIGKLSADGFLVWEARQDGGVARVDQARGVAFARGGDLALVGYATPATTTDTELWLQRRSADGQSVRWTAIREGLPGGMPDRGHTIFAIEDDFVVAGYKQDQDNGQHHWIERIDGGGGTVWADEGALGGVQGVITAVRGTMTGDLILAGWQAAAGGDSDMWLQRRDAGGTVRWESIVGSPGGADDRANVIAVTSDGGFVVGGEMGAGAGSTDAWIRRYSAMDTEVWTDTISGPAGDRDTIWGLGWDPDGNLVACGYIASPATSWDIWVRKYTP
jgi:cysteine-rich repeat protein